MAMLKSIHRWAPAVAASLLALSAIARADGQTAGGEVAVQAAHSPAKWLITASEDGPVAFRGLPDFDAVGSKQWGMAYPAPNPAVLAASIVTHALVTDSIKKRQHSEIQEKADKVLEPYQALLDSFTTKDLIARSIAKMGTQGDLAYAEPGALTGGDIHVEIAPQFAMAQDSHALLLDTPVVIFTSGSPDTPAYQGAIRVVLTANTGKDAIAYWSAGGGEKLKDTSAAVLAESLDTAFHDAFHLDWKAKPFRTVRYQLGDHQTVERAQVLSESCNHGILRTLRGTLMIVQMVPDADEAPMDCEQHIEPAPGEAAQTAATR